MFSTTGSDVLPVGLPPLEVQILLSHHQASANSPKSEMPSLAQPRELRFLCHTVDHSYVTCSTQWTASLRSARLGAVRCPSEALSRASPRGVAEALQQVTRQLQQIPLRSSVCFLSLRQPRRALRVRLMGCEVKHHLLTFLHHVEVLEGSSATVGAGFSVCVAVCFQPRRKELGDEQREDVVQHPMGTGAVCPTVSAISDDTGCSWKEHQGEL